MAQTYKVEKVEVLREELKDFHSFIFTDYRGLNVQQINGLRNSLREKGAHYHVVKNRFVKRVFQDRGYDGLDQYLVNPTALAYFETGLSEIAKVLIDSAGETTLEVKGGYSDGTLLSSEEIMKISRLPSRDALIAQILGLLNAPPRELVMVLSGILAKFVRTLKAVEESKPEEVKAEESKATKEVKAEESKPEEVKAEESKAIKEVKAEEESKSKEEVKPE
jgi:large subunit ribosomal protein L10